MPSNLIGHNENFCPSRKLKDRSSFQNFLNRLTGMTRSFKYTCATWAPSVNVPARYTLHSHLEMGYVFVDNPE